MGHKDLRLDFQPFCAPAFLRAHHGWITGPVLLYFRPISWSPEIFLSGLICNCLNCDYNCDGRIFISFVFPQFISSSFYVSFLLRVEMNSKNWPAPNIWVFIAQLVEHCSAYVEAMGSNPVGALKLFFSGLNLQLPKLRLQLRWSNLHFICISAVHIIFILYDQRLACTNSAGKSLIGQFSLVNNKDGGYLCGKIFCCLLSQFLSCSRLENLENT